MKARIKTNLNKNAPEKERFKILGKLKKEIKK